MKQLKLTIFELGSILWIFIAIFALIFALAGIFSLEVLIVFLALLAVVTVVAFLKKRLQIKKMERFDLIVLGCLFALAVGLTTLTTPTIFGGRDEGTLSTAAMLIAQDHSLKHSEPAQKQFFEIYGAGKALNFPGFYYTKDGLLQTQFLPGYPSWIAVFVHLFGPSGIKLANFFPFITFVFSLYLIIKSFSNSKKFAAIGMAIFALFLPVTTFFKFTLTELFFGALIWFSLYLLLKYLQEKTRTNFVLAFVPLVMTPFVRIESIGLIFVMFLVMILNDFKHIRLPRYQLLFAGLGIAIAASLFFNARFFVETVRNFAEISPVESLQKNEFSPISVVPDDWKGWYMLKIFHTYNMIPLFIMGFAVIFVLLQKKKWFRLVPFFFFLPTLVYVIDANISLDHPWMLRRFTFAIVPLLVLYSALFLQSIEHKFKRLSTIVVLIIFSLNAALLVPLFAHSQNKGLLEQLEPIAKNFSGEDLVLVSQKATGSGWSMMAEPLRTVFSLQAVYFFNPSDFDKLDVTGFDDVFLVVSDEEIDHYRSLAKSEVSGYSVSTEIIEPSREPLSPPVVAQIGAEGKIFKLEK